MAIALSKLMKTVRYGLRLVVGSLVTLKGLTQAFGIKRIARGRRCRGACAVKGVGRDRNGDVSFESGGVNGGKTDLLLEKSPGR